MALSFRAVIFVVALGVTIKALLPQLIKLMMAPSDDNIGTIPDLSINELTKFYSGKKVLAIGGTRGVGYGTALTMAQAGANVTIVGRNTQTGQEAVDKITSAIGVSDRVTFQRGDIGTVKGANDLVATLAASAEKDPGERFDLLVVTAATFPNWDAPLLNDDGMDKSFAIAVVGRFIVYRNAHKFLNSDQDGSDARILNVLASGMKPPTNFDRELASGARESKSLFENMMTFAIGNEIMQIGLERKDISMKKITRVTTHPGFLKTDLHQGQGFLLHVFEVIMVSLMGVSIEECGLKQASILASQKLHKNSLSYVGEDMAGKLTSDELLKLVDDHLEWLWDLLTNLEHKKS